MRLKFFMPMRPPTITHQQKQVRVVRGKPVFYEPAELKAARAKLTTHLAQHKPERPMEGAVQLMVSWLFPLTGKHRAGEYRTTKPDTDNLQKLLKDCMTTCSYWHDDAQVATEMVQKRWNDVPGILVEVMEIAAANDTDDGI